MENNLRFRIALRLAAGRKMDTKDFKSFKAAMRDQDVQEEILTAVSVGMFEIIGSSETFVPIYDSEGILTGLDGSLVEVFRALLQFMLEHWDEILKIILLLI